MKRTAHLIVFTLAALVIGTSIASAQEFGTLKGKFIFKGKAPVMKVLTVDKDKEVCGTQIPKDESLVVSDKGEVRDIVIYALGNPQDINDYKTPVAPIHSGYDKVKAESVVFDNKLLCFTPHVRKVWTEQTLILKNSDPVAHNSFGNPFSNKPFNPMIPANGQIAIKLPLAEKIPIEITCSIHPWMKGYIISRPDPYVDVSAADGSFTIANLPTGTRSFQLWNHRIGYLTKLTISGKRSLERRGRHTITINQGENDLGEIVIDAKDYETKLK